MKKIILSMFLLGTLLSANAQVPNYVPSNGLVGWWPFSGNANDASGNGNNGTVNGASLVNDRFGVSNSAYSFNGLNTFIEVTSSASLKVDTSYSIGLWIKSDTNTNNKPFGYTLLSKITPSGWYGGYEIMLGTIDSTGVINHVGNIGGANIILGTKSGKIIRLGNWQFLVITFNGAKLKLFSNGILVDSIIQNGLLQKGNDPLRFGRRGGSGIYNQWYKGLIDDIGIWNRALSSFEISELYQGCKLSVANNPTNQSSNINTQAQFSALANDTTASYLWQSKQANLSWGDIPSSSFYSGITTKKLTVNNIQVNNHKQLFRVIVTKNTCKDTSVVAMLNVNDTCITSTTDTLYIKVNTSSLSNPIYNTVKVYPNPSSTQVVIDNGNYNTMGSYTAKIINSIGQQVFQSLINQQQFVIDAKTMGGSGVYTLYITDANNKVVGVKKIVLQ
jgi:hypothetical protein